MFNPMQSQAALQNKARFPDQKLQQYASGKPPQPTGQVTPPMAGGELAQRGADRQAFQNEAAMQADPSGRPPVLVEKIMQLQQQEQQLGMLAAMLAKKQQDLAARERGIGALPVRSDMFTAMDGGIVFSGGGAVQRFNGTENSSVSLPRPAFNFLGPNAPERPSLSISGSEDELLNTLKSKIDAGTASPNEIRRFNSLMALRLGTPSSAKPETRVPSTTGEPEPTIYPLEPKKEDKKDEGKKGPTSNVSNTGTTSGGGGGRSPEAIAKDIEQRIAQYLIPTEREAQVSDFAKEQALNLATLKSRMSPTERAAFEKAQIEKREFAEEPFLKERAKLREEEAAALRPEAMTLQKQLGSIVRGLKPGRTLAETLQGGAASAAEDAEKRSLAEQQARIKIVQSKILDNEADRQRKLGNIEKANELADKADQAEREASLFVASIGEKRAGLYALAAEPDATRRKGMVETLRGLGIPLIQGASQERVAALNRANEGALRSEENMRRSFREYQETAMKYVEKILPSTLGYDPAQEAQRQELAKTVLGQMLERDPAMKQWLGRQGASTLTSTTKAPDYVLGKDTKIAPAK